MATIKNRKIVLPSGTKLEIKEDVHRSTEKKEMNGTVKICKIRAAPKTQVERLLDEVMERREVSPLLKKIEGMPYIKHGIATHPVSGETEVTFVGADTVALLRTV